MPDQIGVARSPEGAAQLRRWCPYSVCQKYRRKEGTKVGGGFNRRVTVEEAASIW